ncbi:phosphatidylinositolN-acetyglucosaminlytransferase subunit P-related [Striga asiatica]|uniref:PhosphatidylinositolN-acetyglucosaminlytransferase subunit P-related n=1 Tax=Striga asiatica TaxID=4170 RepID=A0A5A7QNT0_STRAF|nr:phosphatidylinositolN-acetyglucosaminlytransferase subunit P-related [Striga asiatica]
MFAALAYGPAYSVLISSGPYHFTGSVISCTYVVSLSFWCEMINDDDDGGGYEREIMEIIEMLKSANMRTERQGSKARNYVGGLLNLFDWNAKSRKKLSSKAELPEKFKQKKRFNGNMPTTLLHMLDEDEFAAGSSVKGSSDYSCASSLTEGDFYKSKAPNVVARLMGLDSLPKSSFLDPNSTPLTECRSFASSSHYKSKSLDFSQDLEFKCENFAKRSTEKFCAKIMPPRSAKSLISPVRNSSLRKPNDATHLMEAAAKIIKPGPKAREKTKMPQRVRESKEKVQAVKKTSKSEFRHSVTRSWDGSVDYSGAIDAKNNGKSVSLALQAKTNVQKRALVGQKETSESSTTNRVLTSQSHAQKSTTLKKPSAQKGTNVLRQNNQKQNCPADSKKVPPLKSGSQKGSLVGPTKVSSKLASEVGDDKKRVRSRSSAGVAKIKRSFDGNISSEKNEPKGKYGNLVDSGGAVDVVSFTFSAPVAAREGGGSVGSTNSPSKRILLDPSGVDGQKFLSLGQSVDTVRHTFLEGRLKVLTQKEFTQQKTKDGVWIDNPEGQPRSSLMQDGHSCSNGFITGQKWQVKDVDIHDQRTIFGERTLLDNRLPSPVSVFDHISITESSNSSETTDSSTTRGGNLYSSIQFQEADLSDSASSTSKASKTRSIALNSPYHNKSRNLELLYIKKLLSNIEPMFKDYALGKTSEIINPHVFKQPENREEGHSHGVESIPRLDRRLMFDCVNECLDLRCGRFAKGGYKLWAKGTLVVKRNEVLAENVYRDISCWGSMGHFMVDEIVGKDMSSKNGSWLDHEVDVFALGIQIESWVLSSLIDEVVDDILVL